MKQVFFTVIYCLLFVQLIGCGVEQHQVEAEVPNRISPSPIIVATPLKDESLDNAKVSELCKRLNEIKKLPNKDPNDTDPIYEAIMAQGNKAIPCLIEEITNESPMRDPREAPSWEHYKVGDTAVFILVNIAKNDELLEEMLPSKYRNEWKSNGIYAYFNYVSESKNRRQLQQWWLAWWKKNK